jgi:protein-L-isoaspartate(D-aspartate) O-methyltransferase
MQDESRYLNDRQRMVDEQIAARGLHDLRLLDAMRIVPRHCFIPPEYRHLAYADGPLPIGNGQTISQPYIVALMTQLLSLTGEEKVLEIGTGSGYQAAVLALLAKQVYTVERHAELARGAETTLKSLNFLNVSVHVGDGSLGLPEFAPYQAIVVTAAAPRLPKPLQDQLDDGGRIVIPVGGQLGQYLECWRREGSAFNREVLVPVAFVPLRGVQGWEDKEWEGY